MLLATSHNGRYHKSDFHLFIPSREIHPNRDDHNE